LIDRDDSRYREGILREMRAKHEAWVAKQLAERNGSLGFITTSDVVALGPNIVFIGSHHVLRLQAHVAATASTPVEGAPPEPSADVSAAAVP
jgi:hypothetical protein